MIKKILAFLLVLAMLTFFAACKGENDTTSSSSSSVSSEAGQNPEDSSSSSVSETSSETSSDAVSEVDGDIFEGDGFSFNIPEGFELVSNENGNAMFADKNSNILSVETLENKDGKTTLTQKDVEKQLATEAGESEVSELGEISIKVENFKSTKIDGKEAVTFYCELGMLGITIPAHCAEIINGDTFIQFSLITSEGNAKVLDAVLETVKIG